MREDVENMQVEDEENKENEQEDEAAGKARRKSERDVEKRDYKEVSDAEWFRRAEKGELETTDDAARKIDVKKAGAEWERRNAGSPFRILFPPFFMK